MDQGILAPGAPTHLRPPEACSVLAARRPLTPTPKAPPQPEPRAGQNYERIRGLREIGQRRSGECRISKSKTLPVPIAEVFRNFSDAEQRRAWLADLPFAVRTDQLNKWMRVTWSDGSDVHVYFIAKGEEKTQVTVQHCKLADKVGAEDARQA